MKKPKNTAILYFNVSESGKPQFEKLPFLYKYLSRWKGKRMIMALYPFRRTRSLPQNSAFHAILTRIIETVGEEIGYTMEELKDIIKMEYLCEMDKNGLIRIKGTSELNTEEMTDLIDKIYNDWLPRHFPEIKIPTIQEYKIMMDID